MEIANIHEAKSQLSKLVEHAMNGEEVIIAKPGNRWSGWCPFTPTIHPPGGQWKGRVRIAEDFDTLPDDIASAFGSSRHDALPRYPRLPLVARRPATLIEAARKAIGDGKNTVYVSAAAVWEITIKRALGKLDAPDDIEAAMAANRFLPLPITIRTPRCRNTAEPPPQPVRPLADRPGPA